MGTNAIRCFVSMPWARSRVEDDPLVRKRRGTTLQVGLRAIVVATSSAVTQVERTVGFW
jgi:hypothetical protein